MARWRSRSWRARPAGYWPVRPLPWHAGGDSALAPAGRVGRRRAAARARPGAPASLARDGAVVAGDDLADRWAGRTGGWLQRRSEGDGSGDGAARCRGHDSPFRGALLGHGAGGIRTRYGYRRRRATDRTYGVIALLPWRSARRIGRAERIGAGDSRRGGGRRAGEHLDRGRVGDDRCGHGAQTPSRPLAYYREAMADLLRSDDLRAVVAGQVVYRRYLGVADAIVAVADRLWFVVLRGA